MSLHRPQGPNSLWDWTLLSKAGPGNICGPHMVPMGLVHCKVSEDICFEIGEQTPLPFLLY